MRPNNILFDKITGKLTDTTGRHNPDAEPALQIPSMTVRAIWTLWYKIHRVWKSVGMYQPVYSQMDFLTRNNRRSVILVWELHEIFLEGSVLFTEHVGMNFNDSQGDKPDVSTCTKSLQESLIALFPLQITRSPSRCWTRATLRCWL